MWITEFSQQTTANPTAIWQLWADVVNWNKWDGEVASSKLDGDFRPGTKGQLKPKGGPKSAFVLLDVQPEQSFRDRSKLPLANLDFIHTLTPNADGWIIRHRVELSGPLSWLFGRLLGPNLQRGLPQAVKELARQAEALTRLETQPK